MKYIAASLALAGMAITLAGCGGKSAPGAAKPAAANPAATASDDGPHVKPGAWTMALSVAGGAPQTVRICADEAHTSPFMGASQCASTKRAKNPDGSWTLEATCDQGKGTSLKMTAVMTGDPNSAYSVAVQTADPTGKLSAIPTVKIDATWAGACPADLKPGAIETDQGIIDSSGMKGAK